MSQSLIPAMLKNQALLADVHHAATNDLSSLHLWWLGQSGFLVQWRGRHLLIDPYLSDSLTVKYAGTDKPHVRLSEKVIEPHELSFIDVLSSSHNHTDHLDAETIIPILSKNASLSFVIPEANRSFVANRVHCDPQFPAGLSDGESITQHEITIHGVPSSHNLVERDEKGNCKFMGYVFELRPWKIYHSGDTLWYENMVDILKPFKIDVALLPINGNDPKRGVAGNLDTREAALLGKAIGAKMVIPCHYNMFAFNTANPEDFADEARKIGQPFSILQHGERWSSASIQLQK